MAQIVLLNLFVMRTMAPEKKLLYVYEIHSDSREQYEEVKVRIRSDWDIERIEVSKNAMC
ncbi:hypothetical protein D3C71_1926510 [compost metagenome]